MKKALNKHRLNDLQKDLVLYNKYLPALDLKRQQLMAKQKNLLEQVEYINRQRETDIAQIDQQFPWLSSLGIHINEIITIIDTSLVEKKMMGVSLLERNDNQTIQFSPFSPFIHLPSIVESGPVQPYWLINLYQSLKPVLCNQLEHERLTINLERIDIAIRKTTQKVNLFSKVKIPQTQEEMRNIQLFLGDQEKSAVIRSKLAKSKQQVSAT